MLELQPIGVQSMLLRTSVADRLNGERSREGLQAEQFEEVPLA
jgi:hypothetical protein